MTTAAPSAYLASDPRAALAADLPAADECQILETWEKASSTGVSRPKIETSTLSFWASTLTSEMLAGDKKIQVIKVVREVVSGLGLKEAKELVESAPKPILEGVNKEAADAAKAKLEEAGAKISLT